MRKLGVSCLLMWLVACQTSKNNRSAQENKSAESVNPWPQNMQGMAKSVFKLMPYIYSRKQFDDPANRSEIQSGIQSFSQIAHEIQPKSGEKFLGHDPIVRYNLTQLKGDLSRANEAFQAGSLDYARGTLKNVMNHCFNCHSLNNVGAKLSWDLSGVRNLNLTPLEKADLLVATRQFDQSKTLLENLLKDTDYVQNSPFDFESALRRYLAMMVRVEKDPKATLKEFSALESRKEIPFYIHDHLRTWNESLKAWSKEKPNQGTLMDQAKARMKAAHRIQNFAKDHSGDVEYLRVTNLLHEYLREPHSNLQEAEAYYLLGQSYEVLDELGYWNVHETYYENCIRTAPKTPLAQNCYRRLQASVYLGYSGSSGVHVPANERQRLNELKGML